jgi:hypothetical protein
MKGLDGSNSPLSGKQAQTRGASNLRCTPFWFSGRPNSCIGRFNYALSDHC